MKFSLIIGTLNRAEYLRCCLQSLKDQKFNDFEIIIIDQSSNNDTEHLVEQYRDSLNLSYIHVTYQGLSRARNEALKMISGDYFCLIDDDAFYNSEYLYNLSKHVAAHPNGIFSGYMWDTSRHREFASYYELQENQSLSMRQIIRNCPSPALSFPSSVVNKIGSFDTDFGVGAKFGAGEETDFILRATSCGYKVYYYKDLYVEHPHKLLAMNLSDGKDKNYKQKTFNYAYGIGALYKKHMHGIAFIYMMIPFIERALKPLIKAIITRNGSTQEIVGFYKGLFEYK